MKVISWENRKKSLSIGDISPIYPTQKMQACEKIIKKQNKLANISVQVFPSFAFVCHFILFVVGEIGILS